ncbi:GA module [Alloiococcus otitis]|uniref:Protein G-related albumin-binding (GA) module domain-containing protein n=1 Tax=Alloiococcus otitis ATCC 51267 TaxID=883081 RepID=K9ERI8_9LACT|nr:GA module-containing protein [Alloiococcus otitis]EKU93537.1 hypothetical protein HMPREF9698_00832 [Alloiococcus otitis ATCC 51267]SUU80313.1 GA module [Alloiococcus otitis]
MVNEPVQTFFVTEDNSWQEVEFLVNLVEQVDVRIELNEPLPAGGAIYLVDGLGHASLVPQTSYVNTVHQVRVRAGDYVLRVQLPEGYVSDQNGQQVTVDSTQNVLVVEVRREEVDKSDLGQLIDYARGVDQSQLEFVDQYLLNSVLRRAESVYEDPEALQQDVDYMTAGLRGTLERLNLLDTLAEDRTVAKDRVSELTLLSEAEVLAYNDQIDLADSLEAIARVVSEAEDLQAERQAQLEAAETLARVKDQASSQINDLEALDENRKNQYLEAIAGAESVEAVTTLVSAAREENEQAKAEAERQAQLNQAKQVALDELGQLENLPEDQSRDFARRIEAADSLENVQAILAEARQADELARERLENERLEQLLAQQALATSKDLARRLVDQLSELSDQETSRFLDRVEAATTPEEVNAVIESALKANNDALLANQEAEKAALQAQLEAQAEAARQREAELQAQLEAQEEVARQREAALQAQLEAQAEAARQREAALQAQVEASQKLAETLQARLVGLESQLEEQSKTTRQLLEDLQAQLAKQVNELQAQLVAQTAELQAVLAELEGRLIDQPKATRERVEELEDQLGKHTRDLEAELADLVRQVQAQLDAQAEEARQREAALQEQLEAQAEAARQREAALQAQLEAQADLKAQIEASRQQVAELQAELIRQVELADQREEELKALLKEKEEARAQQQADLKAKLENLQKQLNDQAKASREREAALQVKLNQAIQALKDLLSRIHEDEPSPSEGTPKPSDPQGQNPDQVDPGKTGDDDKEREDNESIPDDSNPEESYPREGETSVDSVYDFLAPVFEWRPGNNGVKPDPEAEDDKEGQGDSGSVDPDQVKLDIINSDEDATSPDESGSQDQDSNSGTDEGANPTVGVPSPEAPDVEDPSKGSLGSDDQEGADGPSLETPKDDSPEVKKALGEVDFPIKLDEARDPDHTTISDKKIPASDQAGSTKPNADPVLASNPPNKKKASLTKKNLSQKTSQTKQREDSPSQDKQVLPKTATGTWILGMLGLTNLVGGLFAGKKKKG